MPSEQRLPRLANNWTTLRVTECLNNSQKEELIRFIRDRYEERFLGPIRLLSGSGSSRGFGFAVMALCSLLIETMECYRQGLPTSAKTDLRDLSEGCKIPAQLKTDLPEPLPGSQKVFEEFFNRAEHKKFFPGVVGAQFYQKIRCGLLHQAQTKGGWLITRSGKFWDADARPPTINRDEFAARLVECFDALLVELKETEMDKGIWPNVCRKIRWLVATS